MCSFPWVGGREELEVLLSELNANEKSGFYLPINEARRFSLFKKKCSVIEARGKDYSKKEVVVKDIKC